MTAAPAVSQAVAGSEAEFLTTLQRRLSGDSNS